MESSDLDFINEYSESHHEGVASCQWLEGKGRVLVSAYPFDAGDLILSESSLHVVEEECHDPWFSRLVQISEENRFDIDHLWYWCALSSLTLDQLGPSMYSRQWKSFPPHLQNMLLMLYRGRTKNAGQPCSLLVKEFGLNIDPDALECLLQAWIHNAFEYSYDDDQRTTAYAIYFFPSFMSHSCRPSACWHIDMCSNLYVLRARRDIAIEDEITVSYLDEVALLNHASARRWELYQSKGFWCACARCTGRRDLSRGMRCLRCPAGSLFARSEANDIPQGPDFNVDHWVDTQCSSCGYSTNRVDAQELIDNELVLLKVIRTWESSGLDEKMIALAQNMISNVFSQHVLADRARELICDFWLEQEENSSRLALLMERCDFISSAYPDASLLHASVAMACADSLVTLARTRLSANEAQFNLAVGLYSTSLSVLRTLYGTGNEYVALVERKISDLRCLMADTGLHCATEFHAVSKDMPLQAAQNVQSSRVKNKFRLFNKHSDGDLSIGELITLLAKGCPNIKEYDIQLLCKKMDQDCDGKVNFYEFCDFVYAT